VRHVGPRPRRGAWRSGRRRAGVTALACGVAFAGLAATAGEPWEALGLTRLGATEPAAAFTVTTPDGSWLSLQDLRGKVVLLNFWATWCEPCRAEMPAFSRLHERWSGRGVQFLGLSDEPPEKAASFGRTLGIAYPLWTGGDQVADLSRRLGNRAGGLPHTVVLSSRGEVIAQRVGPYTEAELERVLAVETTK
jgi:thiol-disulfide isomerase/thioredoxin